MEHGGAVGLVGEALHDVHLLAVAFLQAHEFLLHVVAHAAQGHIGTLHLLIAAHEVGDDEVVGAGLFTTLELAELFQQAFLVVGEGFLGDGHIIIRDLVISGDIDVDFGGDGQVEIKGKLLGIIPVVLDGFLARKRFAEDIEFVLFDEFVEFVGNELVDHFGQRLSAVDLLDQRHRRHAAAEAADVCVATILVEFLLSEFRPVFFLEGDADGHVEIVNLVLLDFHIRD